MALVNALLQDILREAIFCHLVDMEVPLHWKSYFIY